MYVGPWQEYKLGQLFSEHSRLLADAVRAQVQAQVAAEHAQQPQLQLHAGGPPRRHGVPLSYSASLRHGDSDGRSHASTDSSRSHLSSTSSRHPHRTGMHSTASSISQLHSPPSAMRYTSDAASEASSLPPLDAAARLAVQRVQDSRIRATQTHPLSHLVHAYYPEASSALSSPSMSHRSLSRQSSAASSASVAASSTSAASAPAYTRPNYSGHPASFHYRPPAHAIPRKRSKQAAMRTGKEVVAAHKQHISKLRTLYGLGKGEQQQGGQEEDTSARTAHGTPMTPTHSSAPSVSLPQLHHSHGSSAASYGSPDPPLVLPPAVMPHMSAETLALYGPVSDELAARLAFYAAPPPPQQRAESNGLRPTTPAAAAVAQARTDASRMQPPPHTRELRPSSRGNPQLLPLSHSQVFESPTPSVGSTRRLATPDLSGRRIVHDLPSLPDSSHARPSSRMHTPMHGGLRPPSHSGSRARLHSSGGVSDSGDFESELDDLLGWAQQVRADPLDASTARGAHAQEQLMLVHE